MIYGADRIVQMPVMQLYDTGLMQQAVENARYMYDKAEKRMDDFYEKYGEFMSPFQKDMDRYQQIVGAVRNGIDQLYASGEDPLRTATGRAKMAQLIRSVDPAEMSRMKANAKMGYEYLKDIEQARARNEFNADYENFLLNQPGGPGAFDDFSSANGAMWTRSAAGRYQDLNQYTGHIFDALKDSFIRTEGPYDYYGVTEGDLAKSLTPDTLGGLLNSDLGKFHYQNAMRDLMAKGITNPSRAAVMEQFRKNVIAANHEKVHENRSVNEMWKLKQEHASRMAAARVAASGNDELPVPPPVGVNTALTMDSANKYITNKASAISNYFNSKEGTKAVNQIRKLSERLNASDKNIAEKYMAAKETYNSETATAKEKQEANLYMKRASNKKDPNFVAWRKQYDATYDKSMSSWNRENTINGIFNGTSAANGAQLYSAALNIFQNNYQVNRNNDEQALLDKQIGYRVGANGNYAYAGNNTVFQPLAMVDVVQGNSIKKHHFGSYVKDEDGNVRKTLTKTISDLIKGKKFYEASSEDEINRTYGSGRYKGKLKNIINERVIFDDEKLNKALNNFSEDELAAYGITKVDDNRWLIPVSHMIDLDLSYADIDSRSDKDVAGESEAGKRQVTRQAQVLSHK